MKTLGFLSSWSGSVIGSSWTRETQREPPVRRTTGYEVVHVYPHDSEAFTQGLIFIDGKLLESTGQEGPVDAADCRSGIGTSSEEGRCSCQILRRGNDRTERKDSSTHLAAPESDSSTTYQTLERAGEFQLPG